MGVHRKSSNIGLWGETGRYPLIYQSIKLTLNYYNRISKMNPENFVHAAFQEQKLLNLPWYRNLEPLLKLDEIYNKDHVTAFNAMQSNRDEKFVLKTETNRSPASKELLNQLLSLNLSESKPVPSKKFRSYVIHKTLTNHFRSCWDYTKSTSPKLEFYHSIKTEFGKESYVDLVKNSTNRYRTTKLRISAHDFEIETGRYSNIPREERICKWCSLTKGDKIMEDEMHVLYHCDHYVDERNKLIHLIKQAPSSTEVGRLITSNFDIISLRETFMMLISRFTESPSNISQSESNRYDCFIHLHSLINPKDPSFKLFIELRSYISKLACKYISRCFEKRSKFIEEISNRKPTSLVITLLRS